MVSQSPYKVYKSPRRNGLATGCSFVVQDKKEVVDVYNKEKTMMAAVNWLLPFACKEKVELKRNRPDKDGTHRGAFEKNKKKIYATQTVCGICGKPVDFSLKYPHPLSPCIDHIIPIAKGGHPSDLDNMQLAHWTCNRQKSDKLIDSRGGGKQEESIGNRVLPHTFDWSNYRPK